ncbi:MAG TPA: ATP-binding cassette domain-containing protein, partial [Lacipirellulaceae bacterium]|nr:ATP-binding cassette domain-containing protein [Lacipirellulaceae bacterium]
MSDSSAPKSQSATNALGPRGGSLLDVGDIGISFGGLKAVQNFSINLPRGGLYGLIGPNGAGKTTVFNLLTGVYQTLGGQMMLDGKSLVGLKPHQVAAA